MVLNECDVKAETVDMVKASDTNNRGFLNKCNEINKRDNCISFISDIKFGSNDDTKSYEKFNIFRQYNPTMKMVFRHNEQLDGPELLFDINMVKSEPGKNFKELDSLKTVNKLFKFDDLNNINIKHFTERELESGHKRYEPPLLSLKSKPVKDTFFKTGRLSLDYDDIGCNYSDFYTETINIIYSNIKDHFMNLCCKLPSYRNTNTKVVGLLYSGGKDSTCRLLELLEQGEHVVPIVNTLNAHNSTDLLLRDIAVIYNLFKIYETKNFKGTLYKPKFLTFMSWCFDVDHVGLTQQPYNMMSLTALGNEFLNNCKRIECCLINGDMGVSYISEMKELYKIAMKFNYHVVNGDIKSVPPLIFPYIKMIKNDIIYKLDQQLDKIFNGERLYMIIPTCQEITVRSIKLAFSEGKYWLYISLDNCGHCTYCKSYNNDYYYTICIPLIEAEPITKDDIVLSRDKICNINSKFSNIFRAY